MGLKRAMMIGLDGADPHIVRRLINEGRLPNFKKALSAGTATEGLDMMGVLPTVTPPNWVSLATGNWPRTHGVTCYHNHTLGKPLSITEYNWDSRRVESEYIWESMANEGMTSIMLNYCQAWPPRFESENIVMIDGTGVIPFLRSSADFQKIIYMDKKQEKISEKPHFVSQASGDCVVYGDAHDEFAQADKERGSGSNGIFTEPATESPAMLEDITNAHIAQAKLMVQADIVNSPLKQPGDNWQIDLPEGALEGAFIANNGFVRRNLILSASDGKNYDTVSVYANRKTQKPMGTAKVGGWSDWIYDTYTVKDQPSKAAYKIRVISVAADGSNAEIYVSHATNIDDATYFYPRPLAQELYEAIGPMMYFGKFDQYNKERVEVLMETIDQMYDWNIEATKYLFKKYGDWQCFYIHLHMIDLLNHWYINSALPGSREDWAYYLDVIHQGYEITDKYIGAMMEYMNDDVMMFITSDHAAVPHSVGDHNPGIGTISGISVNVMEQLGYLSLSRPEGSFFPVIDWSKTRATSHRSSFIYVNLKGRDPDGIVEPEDYDDLVQQIISDLYAYRHPETGKRVISFCMTREEMECVGMGGPHCGDILVQLVPTYCDEHANCPSSATNEGFSLKNLCIMTGGDVISGETLKRPIRSVDVVPTICHFIGAKMPANVEGGIIYQALNEFK